MHRYLFGKSKIMPYFHLMTLQLKHKVLSIGLLNMTKGPVQS